MQPHILALLLALPALLRADNAQLKCGQPAVDPDTSSEVVPGGREAVPHSWPWVVSIRLDKVHHCAGSIVNESWVATAAECIDVSKIALYSVEAGRHCRDCDDPSVQRRQVAKILIHPDFDANYTEHDLALLRVAEPFQFGANVSHVCLPSVPVPDAAVCYSAGWGASAGGNGTNFLKQAALPLVPHLVCSDPDHYGSGGVSKNMLCAGYSREGDNFCVSDYGGPLVCKSSADGHWYLHGVLSAGDSCDQPQRPLVFTRVQEYLTWIVVDGIIMSS